MQYSKLTVAGCAALMFGLLACSGEDGRDGVNGVNGLNGADGTSCSVKSLGDASGYKILCGGDSVGVLLNGKTGATGKQGVAGPQGKDGAVGKTGAQGEKGEKGDGCSVAALSDNSGYEVYCGANKVGTIKNGTNGADGKSCTTQPADDGIVISCDGQITKILNGKDGQTCSATTVTKDGRNGIEMSCGGQVVGTVWDGKDGSDGTSSSNCDRIDNGNGVVTVTCTGQDPIVMYKGVCGDQPFDPADKFCVLGKVYDKCDGKTYKVNREYCDNNTVVELCGEYKKLRNDKYEFVKFRAVTKDEFCLNGIITPKCGDKEFGVLEFCDTTKVSDGKPATVVSYKQCPNTSESIDNMITYLKDAYLELGMSEEEFNKMISSESEEEEEEIATRPDVLLDVYLGVGKKLEQYPEASVKYFYSSLEEVQEICLSDGNVALLKCGTTKYDPTKQFCDIRDNHVYKFDTVLTDNGKIAWMTENLAFEYKLPKVDVEKDDDGVITKSTIVQIMGSVVYEDKVYENFEVNGVRYYTWKSAMGAWDATTAVGDIRKTLDATALGKLKEEDRVVGACPDGWRLPTQEELENLNTLGTSDDNEDGYETLPKSADKTVNFNVNFVGLYDVSSNKVVNSDKAAYFWSSTEDDVENQAYGLEITSMTEGKVNSTTKTYGFTIRCVKAAN